MSAVRDAPGSGVERRKVVDVSVDGGGEGPQSPGTLGGRQARPPPLRGRGAGHRVVDRRLVEQVDAAQHLLGGRIDDFGGGHETLSVA